MDGVYWPVTARLTSAWDSLLWVWQPGGRRADFTAAAIRVNCGECWSRSARRGGLRPHPPPRQHAGGRYAGRQRRGGFRSGRRRSRARWTLLERRSGRWTADFRAVAYDIAAAVRWAKQHSDFGEGAAALLESGEMTVRGDTN